MRQGSLNKIPASADIFYMEFFLLLLMTLSLGGCKNTFDRKMNRLALISNNTPTVTSLTVSVSYNTAKAVTLAGSDDDGDTLTYTIVSGPSHGTLRGSASDLVYTPTNGYVGTDSFTFKANDGVLDSDVATAAITTSMPNNMIVFYNDGTQPDQDWMTVGNWWDDYAHTQPASRAPQNGDFIYLLGNNGPNCIGLGVPPAPLTLTGFNSSALLSTFSCPTTSIITISSNGSVVIGVAGDTTSLYPHPYKVNTVDSTVSTVFQGSADINNDCDSANYTINGNAILLDKANNDGGTIAGDATLYGTSSLSSACANFGNVLGNATFHDFSFMAGHWGNPNVVRISGDAWFFDHSYTRDAAIVHGNATFSDQSTNAAIVDGNATFNLYAVNAGYVSGNATFNDDSANLIYMATLI
jgi:hypothetical protein